MLAPFVRERVPICAYCLTQLTDPRPSARYWHHGPAALAEKVPRPRFKQFAWLRPSLTMVTRGQVLAWWCVTMLVFCAGVNMTRGKGKPSTTTMVMAGLHAAGGLLYKTYANIRGNPDAKTVMDLKRAESMALRMHTRVRQFFGLPVCVMKKRDARRETSHPNFPPPPQHQRPHDRHRAQHREHMHRRRGARVGG